MRRNYKFVLLMFSAVAVLLFLLIYVNAKIDPIIQELTQTTVSNTASAAINSAAEHQFSQKDVNYDSIILMEKNVHGDVTAIRTDISQINRLKTSILQTIDAALLDLDVSEIGIPIGSLVLSKFFSGRGPKLPVRVLSVSTSDAEFRNVFSEAGINQTMHRIMLDVSVVMSVLTPAGTLSVPVTSTVIVAETVIVGSVPNSYVDLNR